LSKVIRKVKVSGPVVTLGQAQKDLHLESDSDVALIDLDGLIKDRNAALKAALDDAWQARMAQALEAQRQQAEARLAEAEVAWREERARVEEERFAAGQAAGIEAKELEVQQAVERFEALRQELTQARAKVLKAADETVVDVAVALAQKITGQQVVSDPKALVRIMRTALGQMAEESSLVLKVHPQDLGIARRFAAHWVAKSSSDKVLKVQEADYVGRGGCMLEGGEENVDARLETQLEVLHEALRTAVDEADEAGEDAG
jgi:flagellar assembly protein FliH